MKPVITPEMLQAGLEITNEYALYEDTPIPSDLLEQIYRAMHAKGLEQSLQYHYIGDTMDWAWYSEKSTNIRHIEFRCVCASFINGEGQRELHIAEGTWQYCLYIYLTDPGKVGNLVWSPHLKVVFPPNTVLEPGTYQFSNMSKGAYP